MFSNTLAFVRTCIFFLIFALLAGIYGTFVILVTPFGRAAQYVGIVQYSKLVLLAMKYITGFSYTIEGKENIPWDEACIANVKHQSIYECYVMVVEIPHHTWVFKQALYHVPFFGWALRCVKPIPINRKGGRSAVEQVIEHGTDRMNKGLWIMLFPEGTRMPVGKTRRFGRSGAYLAKATGRKIVPVAHNSGEFWARKSWSIKPGVAKFEIGPPIDPKNLEIDEIVSQSKTWIESTMRELSPVYAEKAAFYEARGDQDSRGTLEDSRKT